MPLYETNPQLVIILMTLLVVIIPIIVVTSTRKKEEEKKIKVIKIVNIYGQSKYVIAINGSLHTYVFIKGDHIRETCNIDRAMKFDTEEEVNNFIKLHKETTIL